MDCRGLSKGMRCGRSRSHLAELPQRGTGNVAELGYGRAVQRTQGSTRERLYRRYQYGRYLWWPNMAKQPPERDPVWRSVVAASAYSPAFSFSVLFSVLFPV